MTRSETFNFSAGPSVLPEEVLRQAQAELLNYHGTGMSVMEMSHRSQAFSDIFQDVKARFRAALSVPDTHEILFLQGGGTAQFSMIPLNLMGEQGAADYAVTGHFSGNAAKEAEKYGKVHIAADTSTCGHTRIPQQSELQLDAHASYFYYCANNTIYGTEYHYIPETNGVPLFADMSSDMLSRPVDFHKFDFIYAGVQKNLGPAGVVLVVAKKSLLEKSPEKLPTMFRYSTFYKKDSLYNTPPAFCIYMVGKVAAWIKAQGGLEEMARRNERKAKVVYDAIDNSNGFYRGHADKESRSFMNVTFRLPSEELEKKFVAEALTHQLSGVKGHRNVGGMRASIYNAMPYEGAVALAEFMEKFRKENA